MEEKHKDLKSSRQKKVIAEVLSELSEKNPSFYYLPTIEVAAEIKVYIDSENELSREDRELVRGLSRHDIQILLSLH